MKKQLTMMLTLLAIGLGASAQKEYKIAKNSGKLNLYINGAVVEGYSGNEIVFTAPKGDDEEEDRRAKGLRVINGSGFRDNTGIGLDVSENGTEVNVHPVASRSNGIIRIKVPYQMKVYFENKNNTYHDEIILKNLKNEIEVSTSYNAIKLDNNTGPMNVKSLYGAIDVTFGDEVKGPISIVSVYGHVDATIPAQTKANIELGSSYGSIYAADSFKISIDKNESTSSETKAASINGTGSPARAAESGLMIAPPPPFNSRTNRNVLKGKLNGGGFDLILKSNYKNVYLRDK